MGLWDPGTLSFHSQFAPKNGMVCSVGRESFAFELAYTLEDEHVAHHSPGGEKVPIHFQPFFSWVPWLGSGELQPYIIFQG